MRKFIRHPSDIPIEYNLKDVVAHGREYLKDISQGGLCFHSRVKMDPGATIRIQIPIRQPVFEADGIVVWCREVDGHDYDVGVSFGDEKTEFGIRMVEQVCHIEQYKKEVLEKEGRALTGEEAAVEWITKNASNFPR
ncbi:PilZ domain-containing protein [Verrucomicrobiota bacterium]